ncbi:MAG: hypothetical protein J6127_01625 [Clostridiales bacterium]|nr:hypothetical protein [Clostridiales bacterium]
MNKWISIYIKTIVLMIVVSVSALLIWFIKTGDEKAHAVTPLFVIDSPVNDYSLAVDYLHPDNAGYGEIDRITLIDGNGHRNAVWIMFVPNEVCNRDDNYGPGVKHATEESFVTDWESDSMAFNVCGANYAISIDYNDVLNRDVHDSQITRIRSYILEGTVILNLVLIGMLLFYAKHYRVLVPLTILTTVLFLSVIVFSIQRRSAEIDCVASTSSGTSECDVTIYTNSTLCSDYFDRLNIIMFSSTLTNNRVVSFCVLANGREAETNGVITTNDNNVQIDIVGDDNLKFTVSFNH